MRHSHFWELMDGEFGPAYARTLARDLVIDELGDRTVEQALAAGERPRAVWEAVCAAMQVPAHRRWGALAGSVDPDRGVSRPRSRGQ